MPLNETGVFIRGGSIIPTQKPGMNTAKSRLDPIGNEAYSLISMSFDENIFNSSCEVDGYIPVAKVESIWIQGLQSEVSRVIVTEDSGSQYEATWRNASQTSIN